MKTNIVLKIQTKNIMKNHSSEESSGQCSKTSNKSNNNISYIQVVSFSVWIGLVSFHYRKWKPIQSIFKKKSVFFLVFLNRLLQFALD